MTGFGSPGLTAAEVWAHATRTLTSMGFTDYHYYTDLAAGATYTPPVKALATLFTTPGVGLANDAIHIEYYDGAAWVNAMQPAVNVKQDACDVFQDDTQSVRVANGAGALAYKINLTGVTWS